MAEIKTIGLVLAKLAGVFPGTKIGADGMETYGELLQDIPDEVLLKSMRACLLTCRFFPTIAEIREKAEPFLEKFRIEQIKVPDINYCRENVYRVELNPACKKIESCEFANTGLCKIWEVC